MNKQEFKRNKILIDTPVYRLHVFNYGTGIPVLIIPPHAGRSGNIAQKICDKCVEYGKSTYAFELLPATQKTSNTSIIDLIDAIFECQQTINSSVDLIGLCQGGWLSAIYASMYPERINKIALFATPINTKTGQDNIIEKYCETISIPWHRIVIKMAGGVQPGMMQWLSFAMVDPSFVFLKRWFSLRNIFTSGNKDALTKWCKNNSWYDTPFDLAGNWFMDCLENHFVKNKLYNCSWGDIDLGEIYCPLYLYAGDDDQITHPQQMFDMKNVVSTPPKNIHETLFKNAGHTKVFTGQKELDYFAEEFFK